MHMENEDGRASVINTETMATDTSESISKQVEVTTEGDETVAKVRITTVKNGKTDVKVKTFTGTREEVQDELDNM